MGQGLAQPPAPAWAGRRAIVSERSGSCASRDAVNVVRPGFLSGWEPRGPQTHFSDPQFPFHARLQGAFLRITLCGSLRRDPLESCSRVYRGSTSVGGHSGGGGSGSPGPRPWAGKP